MCNICRYAWMHACMDAHTNHAIMYVCICVCMYVYIYIYVYIYGISYSVYTYIHTYTYTNIYIYIYIYTYTHTVIHIKRCCRRPGELSEDIVEKLKDDPRQCDLDVQACFPFTPCKWGFPLHNSFSEAFLKGSASLEGFRRANRASGGLRTAPRLGAGPAEVVRI